MRKYKDKILIIVFIGILIIGFGAWRAIEAADSSLYVSPAQANKEIGNTFDISVRVSPSGQKVCVVEGKINLTKLSCQRVTLGSGVSVQTSPSCEDLSFLFGIQGCATQDKTLFTVTVKAKSSGVAAANFSGVDIIGEGVPISFVFSGGNYTLIAPEQKTASEAPGEEAPGEEEAPEEGAPEEGGEEVTGQLETEVNEPDDEGGEVIVEGGEKESPRGLVALLATVGDFFSLENLLWILLIVVAIIIILLLLPKRKK